VIQSASPSVPCPCQAERSLADSEQIEMEIRAELSRCCCPRGFPCERLDEDKYKVLFALVVVIITICTCLCLCMLSIYLHVLTLCGPGAIPSPLSLHFPTSPPSTLSFTFPLFLFYSLRLFSCFSIPYHSTRIVPLRFQAHN